MYDTSDFFSSFCTSEALGSVTLRCKSVSRIEVDTMKKNKSMNTTSGSDAVDMAGTSFFDVLCLNLAIPTSSSS
jgi:hypothetical protein